VIAPSVRAEVEITGAARVLDGDTLDIGPVRIRLHGVDAPESQQACATAKGEWPCGKAAAARLAALTAGKTVVCRPIERDAYGRLVSTCAAEGLDLGETLVSEGLAWAFVRYSDAYAEQESGARARAVGIWQADTLTAWDWRDSEWTAAAGEAPADCPIKGNISRAGERIYHTPWSRDYARTQINETYGERWFCDEEEALLAGWRAPSGR
jgi:endonuclease YncB( thermonuclease family)